jgi:hypothetical protein
LALHIGVAPYRRTIQSKDSAISVKTAYGMQSPPMTPPMTARKTIHLSCLFCGIYVESIVKLQIRVNRAILIYTIPP